MSLDFELAKTRGISAPSAVGFMPFEERNGKIVLKDVDRAQLAQDAALTTPPNVGAHAARYTFVGPRQHQSGRSEAERRRAEHCPR